MSDTATNITQEFDLVRAPIGKARGLPNHTYTDQGFFEREARTLFANSWTCVAVGADIPKRGDAIPVEAAGKPVILSRDRGGNINAFHNVCSHRGIRLIEEPVRGQPTIVCPYHSWCYGLDGRLVKTPEVGGPGIDSDEALDKSKLGLKPVRLDMWNDFIFVNMSGTAEPLLDFLKPLTDRWKDFDFSTLSHVAKDEFELRGNWKLAIENYLESYHLPWIHPGLNSYSPLDKHYYFNADDKFPGAGTTVYRTDTPADLELPNFPGLPEDWRPRGEYPLVFPNLLLGVQRDHFYGIIIDPLAPDHTRERLHIYFVDDERSETGSGPAQREKRRAEYAADWREIFVEDIGIVERMQRGRHSDTFDGGYLTPAHDANTHSFMKMVADAVS